MVDSEVGVGRNDRKIGNSVVSCPHVTEMKGLWCHSDLNQI